jgi:outer membrane protein OmpA-like peptidoglycan-associated protein
METYNMTKNTKIALAVAAGLSIAVTTGCASKQPNEALDSARATYDRVSNNTLQGEYSTEDLNVAKTKMDSANRAFKTKKDAGEVSHRAYIAEQYALIAEQRSELLRYQAKIENGNMERTRIQVDLRATEARTLQAEAENLQQQVSEREAELARQLKEIEELKALQATNTDRGMVLTLGDVLFDTGESTLKASARFNIERVASFLKKYPDRKLTIEGHTDNVGEADYNYNLSVERAFSVRSALMAQGIDVSRIQAKGFGEDMPVASNDSATGRQQNRRVDLIFDQPESNFSETVISEIDE